MTPSIGVRMNVIAEKIQADVILTRVRGENESVFENPCRPMAMATVSQELLHKRQREIEGEKVNQRTQERTDR